MGSRLRHAIAALALAGATGAAAARMSVERERPYDILAIPRPEALRWLSLGHATLAANLFWLRAVQYIGEPRARQRGWGKLYPLVDLVTDLDPRHGYAYQVGGVILGSVERVEESNAILEKGMAHLPERYTLALLRAFNAFYYQDDWEAAGRYAEAAARAPGAPAHMRATALAYHVKAKRADRAIAFLEELRGHMQDDDSRKAIDDQLRQARLEQAADTVEQAMERYRRDRGLGPLYLLRLVELGYLPAIPADPFGGRLVVDAEGRVRSSVHAFRYKPAPLPAELGREPAVKPPPPGRVAP